MDPASGNHQSQSAAGSGDRGWHGGRTAGQRRCRYASVLCGVVCGHRGHEFAFFCPLSDLVLSVAALCGRDGSEKHSLPAADGHHICGVLHHDQSPGGYAVVWRSDDFAVRGVWTDFLCGSVLHCTEDISDSELMGVAGMDKTWNGS